MNLADAPGSLPEGRPAESYLVLPEHSDEAIACQFVLRAYPWLRFVNPWGRWLIYDGKRWAHDRTLKAFDAVRAHCAEVACRIAEARNLTDAEKTRFSAAIASAQKVGAVHSLVKGDKLLSMDVDPWDADPWLLNTPDGVLDLRSGAMKEHDQEHYMTKMVAARPDGDCPLWRELLKFWTDGDDELVGFLQRFVGYCLTGAIREHALLFLYGSGANGKSTFLNTIIELLGDYCTVAAMETFVETKGERHPADLAMLHGARLVVSQESEEGHRWATSRIKSLTSGDPITARFMRRDFFTFAPRFKLMFAGNHRPGLRHVDEAMRRRINLVPFRVTIPPDQRDPSLPEKLRAELPGILLWALEGCIEWQENGLQPPASVREATDDYLSDEDTLEQWLEETITSDAGGFVRVADLHGSYQTWAKTYGERFMGIKRFSQVIQDRGYVRGRHPKDRARGFVGISLRPQIGASERVI